MAVLLHALVNLRCNKDNSNKDILHRIMMDTHHARMDRRVQGRTNHTLTEEINRPNIRKHHRDGVKAHLYKVSGDSSSNNNRQGGNLGDSLVRDKDLPNLVKDIILRDLH